MWWKRTAPCREKDTERPHNGRRDTTLHCSSRCRICMEATNLPTWVENTKIHFWSSREQQWMELIIENWLRSPLIEWTTGWHFYLSETIITLVNNKFVVCVFCYCFLADWVRIWCTESKNHIGFAQSGQVFELWPHVVFELWTHVVFYVFCSHVRLCGAF